MMDPPKVLLEQSFLLALSDPRHVDHERCAARYLDLVEEYRCERILLVAVSDHLDEFRGFWHRGMLAPVDRLWVGFQHRRAARRLAATVGWPPAVELTLVMCERHRIRRMVTLDATFEQYDLELLPAG